MSAARRAEKLRLQRPGPVSPAALRLHKRCPRGFSKRMQHLAEAPRAGPGPGSAFGSNQRRRYTACDHDAVRECSRRSRRSAKESGGEGPSLEASTSAGTANNAWEHLHARRNGRRQFWRSYSGPKVSVRARIHLRLFGGRSFEIRCKIRIQPEQGGFQEACRSGGVNGELSTG